MKGRPCQREDGAWRKGRIMDFWNYRIMKHEGGTFGLHEVTYDNGEPVLWTEEPLTNHYEDVCELIDDLEMMLCDARKDMKEKSILDEKALMDKFERQKNEQRT